MFAQTFTIMGEVPQSYSIPIVILSILTSCFASYTAVSLNSRVGKESLVGRNIWLILASLSMGLGIWAMHFIGMTALKLPAHLHHTYGLTMLSMIPAFIASFLAFYVANQPRSNIRLRAIAGIFMGLGIIAMHYLGMAAMTIDGATIHYKPLFVTLSIIAAIGISFIALNLLSAITNRFEPSTKLKIATALLLGCATSAAHYIGMASVEYHKTDATTGKMMQHQNLEFIIIGISISLAIIFSILIAATVIDHHIETRVVYFDPLTKLPNRRHFFKNLQKKESAHAISIIKIENVFHPFQEVHFELEDAYLQKIVDKLREGNPTCTRLYRMDEQTFLFVATDQQASEDLIAHLHTVKERFRQPIVLANSSIKVTGFTSIAINSNDDSLEKLYLNAQTTIEHPTTRNHDFSIVHFNSSLHLRNFAEQLVDGLEDAFTKQELFLVYQPKIDARNQLITGAEVLTRWQHPTFGILSPSVFLPILEANNCLEQLTDWIIQDVCRMLRYCLDHQIQPKRVSINIPGSYLTSPKLKNTILEMTSNYDVPLSLLELEITETSLIKEIERADEVVSSYRELGIAIALDDFGTGVSSLSYLKHIPITTLKIDKSFVEDVPMQEKDSLILESMIQLSESLDVETVIEGIETKDQLDFILKVCHKPIVQGYYYSKPLPFKEYLTWAAQFEELIVPFVLQNNRTHF